MTRFLKFLGLFFSIALLFPWSIVVILGAPFLNQPITAIIIVCVCLTMPMVALIAAISYSIVYGKKRARKLYEKLARVGLNILFRIGVAYPLNWYGRCLIGKMGRRLIRVQLHCKRCGEHKAQWSSDMCWECVKNGNHRRLPDENDTQIRTEDAKGQVE
jgi:ribosomal protein L37E